MGLPPCPAFSLLCCPPSPKGKDIPPTRARRALFPGGEGGDSRLFHARGFAPCIPGVEPGRHRNRGGVSRAGGGLAPALPANLAVSVPGGGRGGWGCRSALPLVYFPAPHSPSPLPRRGRGSHKVYFAGGFAPGTPALNRLRHLQTVPNRYPGLKPGDTGTGAAYRALAGGAAVGVAALPCL